MHHAERSGSGLWALRTAMSPSCARPEYPKRPVARGEAAAKKLKARTLTNLYNARPQWLADVHAALDAAVAEAYGWDAEISQDEALRDLLTRSLSGREPVLPVGQRPCRPPVEAAVEDLGARAAARFGNGI